MSTLVEKVARAMALCRNFQFDGFDDATKQKFLRQALAALKAMREPTPTMIDAALSELSDVTVSEPKAAAWDWIRAHRAVVDAAIQEHSTPPETTGAP